MVEAGSACRAPRDATAAGVEQQQVVFTRDAASRSTRRRRGVTVRRRGALRTPEMRLGRLPIREDQKFGPALPPCCIGGCPTRRDGAEGRAQGGVGARMMLLGWPREAPRAKARSGSESDRAFSRSRPDARSEGFASRIISASFENPAGPSGYVLAPSPSHDHRKRAQPILAFRLAQLVKEGLCWSESRSKKCGVNRGRGIEISAAAGSDIPSQ